MDTQAVSQTTSRLHRQPRLTLALATLQRASEASLSREHAAALMARGGQLVDLRPPSDFTRDALPGALNLPVDALSHDHKRLSRGRPVILYGRQGFHCSRAARMLAAHGFSKIYHLRVN